MKLTKFFFLGIAFLCLGMAGLSGCASTEDGGTYTDYPEPDPLDQQIKMQEGMSRVTNSLIR